MSSESGPTIKLDSSQQLQLQQAIDAPLETFEEHQARKPGQANNSAAAAAISGQEASNGRWAREYFEHNNSPILIIRKLAGLMLQQYRAIAQSQNQTAESVAIKGQGDNLNKLANMYERLASGEEVSLKDARILEFAEDMLRKPRDVYNDVSRQEMNVELSDALREHLLHTVTLGTPLAPDEIAQLDALLSSYGSKARSREEQARLEAGVNLSAADQATLSLQALRKETGTSEEPAPLSEQEERTLRTLAKAMQAVYPSTRITVSNPDINTIAITAREMAEGNVPSAHGVDIDFDEPTLTQHIRSMRNTIDRFKDPDIKPSIVGDVDRVLANGPFKEARTMLDNIVQAGLPKFREQQ